MLYVVIWSMQIVVGVVVSPVLAHTLGPAEFGSLASTIALYQLLIVLAVCGLDQALQVERAEAGGLRAARGLLASGMLLTFGVAGIAAVDRDLVGRLARVPTRQPPGLDRPAVDGTGGCRAVGSRPAAEPRTGSAGSRWSA